jgi:hypothetical protein
VGIARLAASISISLIASAGIVHVQSAESEEYTCGAAWRTPREGPTRGSSKRPITLTAKDLWNCGELSWLLGGDIQLTASTAAAAPIFAPLGVYARLGVRGGKNHAHRL